MQALLVAKRHGGSVDAANNSTDRPGLVIEEPEQRHEPRTDPAQPALLAPGRTLDRPRSAARGSPQTPLRSTPRRSRTLMELALRDARTRDHRLIQTGVTAPERRLSGALRTSAANPPRNARVGRGPRGYGLSRPDWRPWDRPWCSSERRWPLDKLVRYFSCFPRSCGSLDGVVGRGEGTMRGCEGLTTDDGPEYWVLGAPRDARESACTPRKRTASARERRPFARG